MQSKAGTVPEFLKSLPDDRRAAMTKLRGVIRRTAPKLEESMNFGMPTYENADGEFLFAFNSQRQYMALYICDTEVVRGHRAELPGLDCGKSCIRFRRLDQLPLRVVETMLRETLAGRRGKSARGSRSRA